MTDQAALSKPVSPYSRLKTLIASEDVQARFAALLGKRAPGFLASVLTVASDQKLIDCEPTSILSVAAKAAILDLPIDPNLGFAWLIPYKNNGQKIAQFQLGYKGYIQLGLRSGQYKSLNATEIYVGEEVKIDRLSGRIVLNGTRTGDVVTGYVAYFCLLNGFEKFVYMSTDEVITHAKKYSKSWGYKDSPWTTNFDQMAKKTVIRRLLSKYGILSIQMMGALEQDQDDAPVELGERFAPGDDVIDGQMSDAPEGVTVPTFDDLKEPPSIYQSVVDAKLSENVFAAEKALNHCTTGYDTPEKAVAWMRSYRAWRDSGADSKTAAAHANKGELPK